MLHAVDMGIVALHALNALQNRSAEMETFVKSSTMFNVVTMNSNTTERRMQIDIRGLKESYKKVKLKRIG